MRRSAATLLTILAFAAAPGPGTAQEPEAAPPAAPPAAGLEAADLEALAREARDSAGAPALGLAVVRPGAAPEIAVAGVRCAGSEAAVTDSDLWHWGSITKSMTATLAARLVEAGAVRWDATIGGLLGDAVPDMRDAYRDVTLRQLLSHHAGLQANIPVFRFREFGQQSETPIADRLRWVRIALAQEPVGPAGETYQYSNSGYVVAAAMLQAATGEPWEALVRREVFEPLGMERAGFGAPVARDPDQPCGHVPGEDGHRPVRIGGDNPAPMGPAGRVHMPLADMARYLAAHASRPADFLDAGSWETLHTVPFGGDYAMGWVAIAPEARWHNGSNTMWYAEVSFHPDGRAAAVVVNDGEIAAVQPAVRGLLGRLMER